MQHEHIARNQRTDALGGGEVGSRTRGAGSPIVSAGSPFSPDVTGNLAVYGDRVHTTAEMAEPVKAARPPIFILKRVC